MCCILKGINMNFKQLNFLNTNPIKNRQNTLNFIESILISAPIQNDKRRVYTINNPPALTLKLMLRL